MNTPSTDHVMDEVVGRVASALAECTQYANEGSEDPVILDRLCFSMRSVSSDIGNLLDEILVTRQRSVESNELAKLQELNTCVGELCVQYETHLFRSFTQGSLRTGSVIGRPKKPINISMVCVIVLNHNYL